MATRLITSGPFRSHGRVCVFVRTRPTAHFAEQMIKFDTDGQTICVHLPRREEFGVINNKRQDWYFKLDGVLHNSSQETVYGCCCSDIVSHVMDGYNGTIMAYGQTGAGKTHTMSGPADNYQLRGVIPRAIAQVFEEVKSRQDVADVTVSVSYVEIYNETLTDLLSTLPDGESLRCTATPLTITEDELKGVSVKGLTVRVANNEKEALNLFFEGEVNRTVGAHALSKHSSRSHCIFTVHVETHSKTSSSSEYTISKLNLVDLAGSERLSKTKSQGSTENEALYINKSLSFLEQYVRALADSKTQFKPFRQCKLTHLLKDSIGGTSNTVVVANIWAESRHVEETLSTLRFAKEVMCVSSDPVPNVHHDPLLLVKKYKEEIRLLKRELAMHDTMVNRGTVSYESLTDAEVTEIARQVKLFAKGSLPDVEVSTVRQLKETFTQFRALYKAMEEEHQEEISDLQLQLEVMQSKEKLGVKASRSSIKGKGGGEQGMLEPGKSSVMGTSPTAKAPKYGTKKKEERSTDEAKDQVGDTDKQGFAIGTFTLALASKRSNSPLTAAKKSPLSKLPWMQSNSGMSRIGDDVCDVDEAQVRPPTPPPRHEAYEQFKRSRGKELNKIFLTNKEFLQKKRKALIDCVTCVNELKRGIDECREMIRKKTREREEQGELTTDDGRLIIDEEEYKALSDLKELKAKYKTNQDTIQALRAEIPHCEKHVNDCRQRLLKEFDTWYKEAFIGGEEKEERRDGSDEAKEPLRDEGRKPLEETEQETFERLQAALLQSDPATTAFYQAQLWTERRAIELTQKRRPGPHASLPTNKSRLPSIMTFS